MADVLFLFLLLYLCLYLLFTIITHRHI